MYKRGNGNGLSSIENGATEMKQYVPFTLLHYTSLSTVLSWQLYVTGNKMYLALHVFA
jgi:hypothetical protein